MFPVGMSIRNIRTIMPRLIRLAHANGILVYAWLEPPEVSKILAGPSRVEGKELQRDDITTGSWRYPVALTDPACVDSMAV